MIQCTNCGKTGISFWDFRGNAYCLKHYEQHLEQEAEAMIYFDGFMQALRDMKPGKKIKLRGRA